ncbi:MAG: ATP-binding protein [Sciscionella sp.]
MRAVDTAQSAARWQTTNEDKMVDSEGSQGSAAGLPASTHSSVDTDAPGCAVVTLGREQDFLELGHSREALGDAAGSGSVVVGVGEVPLRRRVAMLPSNGRAAGSARAVVRSVCARWSLDSVAELAVYCVSELATNAAKHVQWGGVPQGERAVWLVVELWGPLLVVEVRDPSRVLPTVGVEFDWSSFEDTTGDIRLLPESGLGLRLVVDQLEQAGGVFGSAALPWGGKVVFFGVPCGVTP